MKRSDPIREARHVFLITVAVRLVLSFLGVLAALAWAPSWPVVAVVLAPGLTVSVLAAMTFLEKLLGPRYLAIPLLCDVALTTFRFAPLMAAHALQIVDQEADRFMAEMHHRATGPVIRQLRQGWQKPKEEELERLLNRLPELDDRGREEIRRSFDRLVNKLLHPPLESLRDESRHGIPNVLIDALSRLFKLKD